MFTVGIARLGEDPRLLLENQSPSRQTRQVARRDQGHVRGHAPHYSGPP